MSDLPNATVTVTSPDGVTRIVQGEWRESSADVEFDYFPNADGSFTAIPKGD